MIDLTREVSSLTIVNKSGTIEKLRPNWAQQEYLEVASRQLHTTGRIRLITLKARQLGISTITAAMIYRFCFLFDNYKAMAVAHEVAASQNMLKMVTRYWTTDPFNRLYSTKYVGRNHLAWNETESEFVLATAGNEDAGRSATIHALHGSEVGFWRNGMLGLHQAVPDTPGTIKVLESTANGMGNYFHQQWEGAVAGETDYAPIFFPWHRHYEYLASYIGLPYQSLSNLDDEEKVLRKIGLSDDRLAWRRWAIRNKCENDILKFMQEYPATPEEAFISSGRNVFNKPQVMVCYDPMVGKRGQLLETSRGVEFIARDDGPLTLFKKPSPNTDLGRYLIAGDPTRTTEGDFACIQVINRRTLEQVAEWRGRIDPVTFADEVFKLGIYFNRGLVSTEIEGPGYATIGALLAKNYPYVFMRDKADDYKTPTDKYGWSTTLQTKHEMIGWLLRHIVDGSIKFHSRVLYAELIDYVTLEGGGYGPSTEKGFDDTVMAMAQAIACHEHEPPLPAYGSNPPPEPESHFPGVPRGIEAVRQMEAISRPATLPVHPSSIPTTAIETPAEPPWADWHPGTDPID